MSDVEEGTEVFSPSDTPCDTPMWLSILLNLQKGMAETTKLFSEIHADRMRTHSSASSNTILRIMMTSKVLKVSL